MKKLLAGLVVLLGVSAVFAGDAAFFKDIGFSKDGRTYIFGQYGKTDKEFMAWAEIYTVDVKANDYVDNEVYRIKPGKDTEIFSGKQAYENLLSKSEWKLAKYSPKESDAKNLLFIRESETKNNLDEIVFKDFEGSTEDTSVYFHIKLVPVFEGSGKTVRSRFYIDLVKQDQNGNIICHEKVGTPDLYRKGITAYQIDRIFTDDSGKSLVFIVQKTLEDSKGTSIRYMVETFRFD